MKKTMMSLLFICLCLTSLCQATAEGGRCIQSDEAVKQATYGHIDAKGLKALIDSETQLVILDARGPQWHDGNTIPGAILAWYQDSEEDLQMVIPDKNALVVVYCFSFTCPLSPRLADRLVEFGYTNVIEYPAGLKEWRDIAGYPVDTIQR